MSQSPTLQNTEFLKRFLVLKPFSPHVSLSRPIDLIKAGPRSVSGSKSFKIVLQNRIRIK
jgi:hypothetical protein